MKTPHPRSPWFLVMAGWLCLMGALPAQTIFPLKLNDSLATGGHVASFQLSADSSRVVYRADHDTDAVTEL